MCPPRTLCLFIPHTCCGTYSDIRSISFWICYCLHLEPEWFLRIWSILLTTELSISSTLHDGSFKASVSSFNCTLNLSKPSVWLLNLTIWGLDSVSSNLEIHETRGQAFAIFHWLCSFVKFTTWACGRGKQFGYVASPNTLVTARWWLCVRLVGPRLCYARTDWGICYVVYANQFQKR